jgi:hypothetical protein
MQPNNTVIPIKEWNLVLDTLCGYTNRVYGALLTCPIMHAYISSVPSLSLTLINRYLTELTLVTNRKKRRSLVTMLFTEFMRSKENVHHIWLALKPDYTWLTPISRVLILTSSAYAEVHPTTKIRNAVEAMSIRLLHIGNSPWYTALTVGDSNHYVSCLRTGIVADGPMTHEYTDEEWTELQDTGGIRGKRGCNCSEYIDAEVEAYKKGHMMYLVAGSLPFEDRTQRGVQARMRVHVVQLRKDVDKDSTDTTNLSSDNVVFVVDKFYGVILHYTRMLQYLLTMYPGRVYLNDQHSKHKNVVTLDTVDITQLASNVYSDADMTEASKFVVVSGMPNPASVTVSSGRVYLTLSYNADRACMHLSNILEPSVYRESRVTNPLPTNLRCKLWVHSRNLRTLQLLCGYYKLPAVRTRYDMMSCGLRTDSIFNGSHYTGVTSEVTYKFRRTEYMIYERNGFLVLCKSNKLGRVLTYNLHKGTWEEVRMYQVTEKHQLTNKTIHLISKYLPKDPNRLPRNAEPKRD